MFGKGSSNIESLAESHSFIANSKSQVRNDPARWPLSLNRSDSAMRRLKPQSIRNQLDLGDARQVRSIKKRLRLSEGELNEIVSRIGNSIAAISKEVSFKKARRRSPPPSLPESAVIAEATSNAAEPSIVDGDVEGIPPPAS